MGSHATFSVDSYHLFSARSYADPVLMSIFTERDRVAKQVWLDENGEEVTRKPEGADDDYAVWEVRYTASRKAIVDRLEVMGFTLRAARQQFEQGIRAQLAEADPDDVNQTFATMDFDKWVAAFREIKDLGVHYWDLSRVGANTEAAAQLSEVARLLLREEDHIFHFYTDDVRYLLRAILDACGAETVVSCDLSDVVNSGYYEPNARVSEMARAALSSAYPANAKIVILTEGSTDSSVLKSTMDLLYPHLSEYYSFMDFHSFNSPGGVGPLVSAIKAFAGAGISNRIIALFDNDTAAKSAMRSIASISLPASKRLLHLPDIAIGRSYPTQGPTGLVDMDVNGLAGGLELYFGEDVLRRSDGNLTPVHWLGYDQGVRAYQGELMGKSALQAKFKEKLETATADSRALCSQDWAPMHAVFDHIRKAFHQ